jgi:hypothetical protein
MVELLGIVIAVACIAVAFLLAFAVLGSSAGARSRQPSGAGAASGAEDVR